MLLADAEIVNRVVNILLNGFQIDQLSEDMYDKPLTGEGFFFDGFRLFEMMLCIEKEFRILFTPEDFKTNSFLTINGIQKAIKTKLKEM